MRLPRRLPAVPVPVDGEWFVSWHDRMGMALDLARQAKFEVLGLSPSLPGGQFALIRADAPRLSATFLEKSRFRADSD